MIKFEHVSYFNCANKFWDNKQSIFDSRISYIFCCLNKCGLTNGSSNEISSSRFNSHFRNYDDKCYLLDTCELHVWPSNPPKSPTRCRYWIAWNQGTALSWAFLKCGSSPAFFFKSAPEQDYIIYENLFYQY